MEVRDATGSAQKAVVEWSDSQHPQSLPLHEQTRQAGKDEKREVKARKKEVRALLEKMWCLMNPAHMGVDAEDPSALSPVGY